METNNNNLILKVSRLFPSSFSSCHFRALPDVAETTVSTLSKTSTDKTPHRNDNSSNPSSFRRNKPEKIPKKLLCSVSSDAEGRKCPPATPMSSSNPKRGSKIHPKNAVVPASQISSNSSKSSGWFSSGGDVETDTFFSLSSNSGDSFRLKTSRRFKVRDEEILKSIDETGPRRPFSSVGSLDTVLTEHISAKTTRKELEKKSVKCTKQDLMGSDNFSADQLYYHHNNARRRRVVKHRRRVEKSRYSTRRVFDSAVIGESYAVEKSSRDPRGDFKASMVEMIVEKHMFGAEELERLLLCFLSLNAVKYHGMIYDVFTEICETLFTN